MYILANNFKYTLQKNKSKLLIGSSILILCVIAVGSYFLFGNQNLFGKIEDLQDESTLADYIVSGSKDGNLSLLNSETGENLETVKLPEGEYLYSVNKEYETVYAYDGNVIRGYEFNKDKVVELGEIANIQLDNVTDFKVDGSNIALISEEGMTVTYQYLDNDDLKVETFELDENVSHYNLTNETLSFSTGTNLHSFSASHDEVIDLGDTTNTILSHEDKLLTHNQFGSGLNDSILVSLDKETMEIYGLNKTNSSETNLIPIDEGDRVFYTMEFVQGNEPYHLLDEWNIQDGNLIQEKDKSIKIPVQKDGIVYNEGTTVGSKGYLYTHYKDRTQIFDIRSQERKTDISVSEDFATPILKE